MQQKYAVVDIGTLKVKFLVASLGKNKDIIEIYSSSILNCPRIYIFYGRKGLTSDIIAGK